jgi:hypothetical protein
MTPVATTDDWGYSRSVEILLDERRLTVFPVVAATAVFQILWGAVFALFSDNTLGAVRVSTLVITAIGGLALYDLCRQLGASAGRSALGVAAFLFNPLMFVLSYSFMTDPHFASVMVVATAFAVRGIRRDGEVSLKWLIATSIAASVAILIRQQGVLIAMSVAFFLILRGDIRLSRSGLRRLAATIAIPIVTTIAYLAWLQWFNGVPDVQSEFASEIRSAGFEGSVRLISSLTYFELLYAGFFLLPLTAATLFALPAIVQGVRGYTWILAIAVAVAVCAGIVYFADTRRRMPYVPQFMGSGGLGPPDIRGSRPRLFHQPFFDWLTAISAISSVMAGLVVARGLSERWRDLRHGPGMVIAILLGQIAGVIPPSYHYLNRGYSLDRYLLPILPLAICFMLWALNRIGIIETLGWCVVVLFAVFALAGTRDYLNYIETAWKAADYAIDAGARPDQIDAGAAWVGYHLYTDGVDQRIERARTRDGPWWTYFYGKLTDSSYVISGRWLNGYVPVASISYPSTLQRQPTNLYLLRRNAAPWPPEGADASK